MRRRVLGIKAGTTTPFGSIRWIQIRSSWVGSICGAARTAARRSRKSANGNVQPGNMSRLVPGSPAHADHHIIVPAPGLQQHDQPARLFRQRRWRFSHGRRSRGWSHQWLGESQQQSQPLRNSTAARPRPISSSSAGRRTTEISGTLPMQAIRRSTTRRRGTHLSGPRATAGLWRSIRPIQLTSMPSILACGSPGAAMAA